jgi:hypothetical protein
MYPGQAEAWALTLGIEGVAAAVLGLSAGRAWWRGTLAAVLGSLVSHPIVWAAFFAWRAEYSYWTLFAGLEAFAVLSETPFYRFLAKVSWPVAFALSLTVNAISAGIGLLR